MSIIIALQEAAAVLTTTIVDANADRRIEIERYANEVEETDEEAVSTVPCSRRSTRPAVPIPSNL